MDEHEPSPSNEGKGNDVGAGPSASPQFDPHHVHTNNTGCHVLSDPTGEADPVLDYVSSDVSAACAIGACVWAPRVVCVLSRFPFVAQLQRVVWQLYATATTAHTPQYVARHAYIAAW